MHNLEVLAVVPCALFYDPVTCLDLHMPYSCKMRECLWEYSITGSKGDSKGFGFSLRLSLVFSFLDTGARDDRKAITVPQGLPDRIY